jgi:hypothetical protein
MNQPSVRTEQQARWQQQIADWQQSGLSQAAYCDTHDLVYHQFTYWRRKLATDDAAPTHHSRFVAVQRTDDTGSGLILSLPNGMTIHGLNPRNLVWLPQLLERLS